MRYFFFAVGLCVAALSVSAQNDTPEVPAFTWNLLWAGSWEESRTLHNRGDFRLDLARQGLLLRAQVLDRRPLILGEGQTWAGFSDRAGGASLGLYHNATGSRLLYGVLNERGLPARIRSPWIRSAPYAETRQATMADLRTIASTTRQPEAYLYLSSPRLALLGGGTLPEISLRGFAAAQVAPAGNPWPAFSGGLEAAAGTATVSLEAFFTGTELPARESSTWFSGSPPLPDREFRLGAAALAIGTPYFQFASDWAWSWAFAYGSGFYGNAAVRFSPPPLGPAGTRPGAGPWSLSLAVEGVGDRYIGRDGTIPGEGFRAAGRIERRGPRSGLFRADTSLRSPGLGEPFDRSSAVVSYRFPAPPARAEPVPLRVSRMSLGVYRNASNPGSIQDSVYGTLGLSLNPPPMLLPPSLLPPTSGSAAGANAGSRRARIYPVGITFSAALWGVDSGAKKPPPPYPFFSGHREFGSARISCALLWSPGIFQLRTRWFYMAYSDRDGRLDGYFSAAVRFGRGRFGARVAWPDFPENRNYTFSWRLER
ncbi:MAG: hypothetical protein FWD88_08090 [Treponema sp.]|nr:hypothetical protein [Treponema sp.]